MYGLIEVRARSLAVLVVLLLGLGSFGFDGLFGEEESQ
jgi:hypothetical protein